MSAIGWKADIAAEQPVQHTASMKTRHTIVSIALAGASVAVAWFFFLPFARGVLIMMGWVGR